jgi:hypothetical protein
MNLSSRLRKSRRNVLMIDIRTSARIARERECVNMARAGTPARYAIQTNHPKNDVSMATSHQHVSCVMDLEYVSTIRSDQSAKYADLISGKDVHMENKAICARSAMGGEFVNMIRSDLRAKFANVER